MIKLKNVINKHKSNKIKENSNTVRHLNNGTDHHHSKSCCDQSSPARRTIKRCGLCAFSSDNFYSKCWQGLLCFVTLLFICVHVFSRWPHIPLTNGFELQVLHTKLLKRHITEQRMQLMHIRQHWYYISGLLGRIVFQLNIHLIAINLSILHCVLHVNTV